MPVCLLEVSLQVSLANEHICLTSSRAIVDYFVCRNTQTHTPLSYSPTRPVRGLALCVCVCVCVCVCGGGGGGSVWVLKAAHMPAVVKGRPGCDCFSSVDRGQMEMSATSEREKCSGQGNKSWQTNIKRTGVQAAFAKA